ncbi:uncharacterized protein [Typha angustifolia]|uniref:uncharacterized protein n=1 Tax=Typha angustifolia TaxID=59011 RepID=UPI003C2E9750
MAEKPLMLKDYLALDSYSESCDGFRCYPRLADAATVRHLIDAELRGGGGRIRTRSKGALRRISAAIKLKLLPFSSSTAVGSNQEGSLSRSFSKRLKGSFWNKRAKEDDEIEEGIGERPSFECPSPVVSSCSSWSDSDSSGSDFLPSSIASSEKESSPPRSPCGNTNTTASKVGDEAVENATGHRDQKGELLECPSEEEKEQLSPVSVMDFPFEDEEDDEEATTTTASPSFRHANARIERTKLQLLQKIRRFDSLAELAPVDLEERFATCDDHVASSDGGDHEDVEEESTEGMAWGLLGVLKSGSAIDPDESLEKLLVDFFTERLSCTDHERSTCGTPTGLLEAAREWINGEGCCWELQDGNRGEMEIIEMEKNGRWRCFEEDERVLGSDLEGLVLDSLVEELVSEILVGVN